MTFSDKALVDNFQAIAVLLAIAPVVFGVKYPRILEARDKPAPPPGPVAQSKARRELWRAILYDTLPVALASGHGPLWQPPLALRAKRLVLNNTAPAPSWL